MINRRKFLKLGAASAAPLLFDQPAQAGEELRTGGKDYSPLSGTERESVATACALCQSRCPSMAYVENKILVKLEGLPESQRSMGNFCARGQAGVTQVYDPDRILQPMKRVGERGEGKWQQISWDEALSDLGDRLQKLREAGQPEKFMFHHGKISASADRLINRVFMPSYGSATIASDDNLDQSARYTAHQLTWGTRFDSWDFEKTHFVLNFGSNVFEADSNYLALSRRLTSAITDRGIKLVTFDVRMSNTAAKSDSWEQVKPGTDAAVVLAMCHVIMKQKLYLGQGEAFLEFCQVTPDPNATLDQKVAALSEHLKSYTPAWAEKISGVSARQIADIAVQFATTKPACVISGRGVSGHHNGVEAERAIQMLAAITGNIDNPGGRCLGVLPQWQYPTGLKVKPQSKRLEIVDGVARQVALPIYSVGNQVLPMVKDGQAGRPEVYLWYNYNPALSNGNIQQNLDILADQSLLPFTVAVTSVFDESAALADLILPDTNYLETFDFEDGVSPNQIAEYSIRQPVVKPQGQARDFKDVCCQLASKMGLSLGFESGEEFLQQACELTPDLENIGGFDTMTQIGVWSDPKASPAYYSYKQKVSEQQLNDAIFDKQTGVYWNWRASDAASEKEALKGGYRNTPGAFKGYIARRVGETPYSGFKPDKLNTTGLFEIYSPILADKGLSPLPTFAPIASHQTMQEDELILTTFQVNVQTPSKTQNCRLVNEISDENLAWINPQTAVGKGIVEGDKISVSSALGSLEITAKVTQLIMPGVIAVASHGVNWEYGRYASGKPAPFSVDIDSPQEELKWWHVEGKHPNWIIDNVVEPISGQQCWKDTVVTIAKV